MIEKISELALKFNLSVKIEEIDAREIKLDRRARWKCLFGCDSYGKPSCPPNVPDYEECLKFVRSYKKAFALKFKVSGIEDVKRAQEFILEAEKSLKKPFAFATFPGGCVLCDECAGRCSRVRPSISALCVDASQFGLESDEMLAILFVE